MNVDGPNAAFCHCPPIGRVPEAAVSEDLDVPLFVDARGTKVN